MGYGQMGFGTKPNSKRHIEQAHRIAWQLECGPIPEGKGYHGTVVRHKCDRPLCCNINHLELGSQSDNNQDKVKRGTTNKGRSCSNVGERNGQSKLTEADVRFIRSSPDITVRTVMDMFKLSRPSAIAVIERRTWKHI
ncbi:hypothetical protein AD945_04310 [Gluconobacter albidus]|uniref:HNH nuclease domain-containing protein n=2 Tax=Gluconobacter albidus TaxID=318683 RepID=A0A149TLI9_9PROT|nr:hypothetical protein AD945_04310 [Gluconobacter albidus]